MKSLFTPAWNRIAPARNVIAPGWNRIAFVALAPFCVLSAACTESVESTDIRTSGVYPEITVTATGNGQSTVEVRLKTGGSNSNTFLDLQGDDTLEATVDGETKTLDEEGNSNRYRATFATDAEGTLFSVAFLRGDEDDSAPESTVTMPAPFTLTLPVDEASRETDSVDFTWDPPASGEMSWSAEGDCIISKNGNTPDDGEASIAAGAIDTFDADKDESCTVDLELVRSRGGIVDPAFTEGGRIEARQVRSDSFESKP